MQAENSNLSRCQLQADAVRPGVATDQTAFLYCCVSMLSHTAALHFPQCCPGILSNNLRTPQALRGPQQIAEQNGSLSVNTTEA